ncbi:dihydroorotase [Kordia periserrulae]|uniref:Dihydroorotase n=1 Tax=Kordia periserrulae TaxID=701523 RepID=A0A2T6C3S5_9FLAO|nr:dihydroorotase [Kordia periserrulae]PTX62958.1 dihydroorotase [Kordia periserrulae]
MNLIIKSATIIDKTSEHHGSQKDILIENGVITQIATSLENSQNYETISLENLHISQGWFDSSVSLGEPGFEERETIENGLKTAAKSGFTAIAVNPNAHPIADTKADISYLKSKAFGNIVDLHPIGALTNASKSVDLAEVFDMKNAGAVAFGDYQKAVKNPNLLKIALLYADNFDGLVLSFPQEDDIVGKGIVNEGYNSTRLGLKGMPSLAEELHVARDLFLLEYTKGKLHIPTISTAKSVELIRKAKAKGLNVSCSVAIHNLVLTDDELEGFDTNYKVLPPLRTENDRKALIAGIEDGTIDMVTSDHNPIDVEHKKVEFDNALYGTIGLESAFGALQTIFDTETTIKMLSAGKERFGVETSAIAVGQTVNLTLFNPEGSYTFSNEHIHSSSQNSAFLGKKLKGSVYGIVHKNQKLIS